MHDGIIDVYGSMIRRFKTLMDSGEEVPDCLMKTLLESQKEEKLEWEDLCMLAAVFTLGGVHSVNGTLSCILINLFKRNSSQTSGVILWFLALIPSHPHVAAKAYEELDRVVGHERYPNAEDERNCPYIRAIIKEVLFPLNISNANNKTSSLTYSAYQ